MPIMFNSLLKDAGIDPKGVRLVRHHDTRAECLRSPYSLWKEDPQLFEEYQCLQGGTPFQVGNHLASFVKTPQNETLFVGAYKVDALGVAPQGTTDLCTNHDCTGFNLYSISVISELSDYKGRLSIEWGQGYLAWYQLAHKQDKPIRELRIKFEEQPFPGYFLFRWKLNEINLLPVTWIDRLRAVKGIYVLTSLTSREHYVGSAASQGGFFQRWQQHAATGGAAVGLQAHGAADYQVAILQVAAGFESDDDIVRIENQWMAKLQTRGMGLNGQPRQNASTAPQGLT
ncbi:GIY-YIG nuclease family protein [Methylobacterium sp. GC_Met_2]|uniref:GIY-YIG nuclease family protein n=1 Tax=Methylobacterium sp. GC_Met_2 TaxID=2937376 RepID=UPI00226B7BC7|nr:GIY-YIG nuclease family protein [Methylobacterium sp. GC_Met_2]